MAEEADRAMELCKACGLCCLGAVHSHVALDPGELALARALLLRVDEFDDGLGFHLPCPQHQNGQCATYQQRPRACVEYQCELLQRLLASQVALEDSLLLIGQAKAMLDRLWAQLPGGKSTPITFQTLRAIVGKAPRRLGA